ncbi:MAG: TetR/AcrR family transcriptional regulator [Lachnospiraceae bacterium]|nr:TetR/AcrR family transcriptional regulator [Lachnospiraceae bacterium]
MPGTRIPKSGKAVAKRDRIIEKGFELMCERGYYKTTTPEIAKAADVSTGIIYQYFNDKRGIFMEGLKQFSNSVLFPMMDILDATAENNTKIDLGDLEKILDRLMTLIVQSHRMTQKAHEELEMMAHADEEIGEIFKTSEFTLTKKIVAFLEKNDIILENPIEKIHIIYGLVENYCHETVYHHHAELNNEVMRSEVIKIIKNILKESLVK